MDGFNESQSIRDASAREPVQFRNRYAVQLASAYPLGERVEAGTGQDVAALVDVLEPLRDLDAAELRPAADLLALLLGRLEAVALAAHASGNAYIGPETARLGELLDHSPRLPGIRANHQSI